MGDGERERDLRQHPIDLRDVERLQVGDVRVRDVIFQELIEQRVHLGGGESGFGKGLQPTKIKGGKLRSLHEPVHHGDIGHAPDAVQGGWASGRGP